MNNIKILYFDRIDVSEEIVNKTSKSKEWDIYHCWYFLNKGSKFQLYVCNKCHDLLMMSINLSNVAILTIKGSDYHCIISRISNQKSHYINFCKILIRLKKVEYYKN